MLKSKGVIYKTEYALSHVLYELTSAVQLPDTVHWVTEKPSILRPLAKQSHQASDKQKACFKRTR